MIRLCRCLDCGLLFTVLQPSEYSVSLLDADEINAEWQVHRDHRVESLEPVPGTTFSRDPYEKPDRVVYFMATNGREQFLAAKRRLGPAGGYRYELHRGCLIPMPPALSLQEDDLLRQIVWEKSGELPDSEEIAGFIRTLQDAVARLAPADLIEEVADLRHPLVSYAKAPQAFFFEVMARLRTSMPPEAAAWFSDFINRHRDDLVPLGIRVKRDFEALSESSDAAGERSGRDALSVDRDKTQSGKGSRGA